jgi:hypothetical protein
MFADSAIGHDEKYPRSAHEAFVTEPRHRSLATLAMKLVPCLGLLLTAAGLNPASTQTAPAAAPNSSALAGTRTNEKLSTPPKKTRSPSFVTTITMKG